MLVQDGFDPRKISRSVAPVRRKVDARYQPELRLAWATALHVDVHPLTAIEHDHVELIRPDPKECRHEDLRLNVIMPMSNHLAINLMALLCQLVSPQSLPAEYPHPATVPT
jgi:hypothetical protein